MKSKRVQVMFGVILLALSLSSCVPGESPTPIPSFTPGAASPPAPTAEAGPIPSPIPAAALAWHGEWVVWFRTDEIETLLCFQQDGKELSTMIYDISRTTSEDRRGLTGEINEMGFTRK